MKINFRSIVTGLLLILLIAGCQESTTTHSQPGKVPGQDDVAVEIGSYHEREFDTDIDVRADSFSDVDELKEFVQMYERGDYYGYRNYLGSDMVFDEVAAPVAMRDAAVKTSLESADGSDGANDFSGTNNQVAGVDEADILKTDGNYIYTITGNVLYIIKAYPGEDAEVVSTIKFDNNPTSLFVYGDKLAVFGNFYDLDWFRKNDFRPGSGMTFFNIYDISEKDNPELEKEFKFEGRYFDARMLDNYVYFVVQSRPELRVVDPMPVIFEDGARTSVPIENIYRFNVPYTNPQFITVHAIDMEKEKNTQSKTIAADYGQELYMSENNIYITYTERINEWDFEKKIMMKLMEPYITDADKLLIEKIKQTDNDVLSQYEKESKIFQIYESYSYYLDDDEEDELQEKAEDMLKEMLEELEYFEFTVINKISVDDGKIDVAANGKVPGQIINQFSLDEHDGILRIATTLSARWDRFSKGRTESTNNVYTLDKDLNIVGRLENLAEGESIYSTRFMGDRLYMVTFRRVDPFFVIDLSDPEKPKILGKLKIPGFSRYLHPYDENTIIGLGRDTTDSGRTQGLKISLFDVTDVENPKELAKFVTDEKYAQSSAEYEHKAFLFSKEKHLLVIPAYNYDYRYDGSGSKGYNGAFVFDIDKHKIELRGLIDHSKATGASYWYRAGVERSLYIEDLLYTKSPTLLRINKLDDLSPVKDVELKDTNGEMPIY